MLEVYIERAPNWRHNHIILCCMDGSFPR